MVAQAAVDEGHSVTLFLAGDAVQLLHDGVLKNLSGLGIGNLRQSYDALVAMRQAERRTWQIWKYWGKSKTKSMPGAEQSYSETALAVG